MIRGILFDVDGVLINSEETIAQACIEFFKRRGVHAVPADFAPFIGAGENRFILPASAHKRSKKLRAIGKMSSVRSVKVGIKISIPVMR